MWPFSKVKPQTVNPQVAPPALSSAPVIKPMTTRISGVEYAQRVVNFDLVYPQFTDWLRENEAEISKTSNGRFIASILTESWGREDREYITDRDDGEYCGDYEFFETDIRSAKKCSTEGAAKDLLREYFYERLSDEPVKVINKFY